MEELASQHSPSTRIRRTAMGSSASKGARAAGAGARKYPTRPPPSTSRPPASATPRAGPSVRPPPQASDAKPEGKDSTHARERQSNLDKAIDLDARDPAFASRLSSLGAVQPNPHYSPTSTSSFDPQRNLSSTLPSDMMNAPPQSAFPDPRDNPVLRVLQARQAIQDEAEEEIGNVGRRGFQGRKYVDAGVIQLALMRRQHGEPDPSIEEALGIRKGRLGVLGVGKVDAV